MGRPRGGGLAAALLKKKKKKKGGGHKGKHHSEHAAMHEEEEEEEEVRAPPIFPAVLPRLRFCSCHSLAGSLRSTTRKSRRWPRKRVSREKKTTFSANFETLSATRVRQMRNEKLTHHPWRAWRPLIAGCARQASCWRGSTR